MLGEQNCDCRILNNSGQYRTIFYFINSHICILLSQSMSYVRLAVSSVILNYFSIKIMSEKNPLKQKCH